MAILVGMQKMVDSVVSEETVASAVGSGAIAVYATPMMIAQMERAASTCIAGELEAGQVTVGTKIQVEHSAATPIGMRVRAVATVTAVNGRQVDFEVLAYDECGEIGKGTHTRFVVEEAKFMLRTQQKAFR